MYQTLLLEFFIFFKTNKRFNLWFLCMRDKQMAEKVWKLDFQLFVSNVTSIPPTDITFNNFPLWLF